MTPTLWSTCRRCPTRSPVTSRPPSFFCASRRRHTRCSCDWSSDVCSSDLDKDLAAKVVKETDAGIVINGARMVSTLCAFSDDLMVMPSTYIAGTPEAAPYAFGFSIKTATPGLRFICRPSVMHLDAASPMDYPLSSRLDEG